MAQEETFGTYLRRLREHAGREHIPPHVNRSRNRLEGMSREELARLAGCSVSYVDKIERGESTNVSADLVAALVNAVNATDAQKLYATALADAMRAGNSAAASEVEDLVVDRDLKTYVNSLSPHLAGYVDLAWNTVYVNREYERVFRGITDYGNVLWWLLLCDDAKDIMVDWFQETHLTVSWSRALRATFDLFDEYDPIFRRLEFVPEFQQMLELGDPELGRSDPAQRIKDPDTGEKFDLQVNLWSPPGGRVNWQMYLGVRRDASRWEDGQG